MSISVPRCLVRNVADLLQVPGIYPTVSCVSAFQSALLVYVPFPPHLLAIHICPSEVNWSISYAPAIPAEASDL